MDPLTAWAQAVKAVAEMITELSRGQSDEQKKKLAEWWIRDMERWRRFWKLDDEPGEKTRTLVNPDGPHGR